MPITINLKRSFKLAMLVLLISGSSLRSFSQGTDGHRFKLEAGPDFALPVINLNGFSFGLGAQAEASLRVVHNLETTLNVNYINFFVKEGGIHFSIVPVKLGLKYFALNNFYVQAAGGYTFLGDKLGNAIAYAGGLGYETKKIDYGIRFEEWSKEGDAGFIGLHASYKIR